MRPSASALALAAAVGLSACSAHTTGATGVNDDAATLHAVASCGAGETCTWYWEYWDASGPRSAGRQTLVAGPVKGSTGDVGLSAHVTDLYPHTTYRWVFCGSSDGGRTSGCTGDERFTTPYPGGWADAWDSADGWQTQATPDPAGSTNTVFSGISCTSATACTAVGTARVDGSSHGVAERWNGATWTIQPLPTPAGSSSVMLNGVACASAAACTAVGVHDTSAGGYVAFAYRSDGTSWTVQGLPNPGLGAVLDGISCPAPDACVAVGFVNAGGGTNRTLAERWDGSAWTVESTPDPGGTFGLRAVSCSSASACTAVGNSSGGALVERRTGTSWSTQSTPNAASSGLTAVSCPAPTSCTAVGGTGAAGLTLAEHWDGTSWAVQATPSPPVFRYGALLAGVSCSSPTVCAAVGDKEQTGRTFALRLGGGAWTLQDTADPGAGDTLAGVACVPHRCVAVGGQ